ncbi:unnamed protein product [Calypogeia fissa]
MRARSLAERRESGTVVVGQALRVWEGGLLRARGGSHVGGGAGFASVGARTLKKARGGSRLREREKDGAQGKEGRGAVNGALETKGRFPRRWWGRLCKCGREDTQKQGAVPGLQRVRRRERKGRSEEVGPSLVGPTMR